MKAIILAAGNRTDIKGEDLLRRLLPPGSGGHGAGY